MALIHGPVHGTKILVSMHLMTVQTSMELVKVLFLKRGGWSSDHHSYSMRLTVAANKIHGLMSNVERKDVRIFLDSSKWQEKQQTASLPLTQFSLKTLKSSVAYIHLQ